MDRKKKIESIYIDDEMLNDPKMDELLKKNMMEEADRVEKELNEDPALQGIRASDDMFDLIKARLQAQGVWEEDNEEKEETDREEKDIKNEADADAAMTNNETDVYRLLSKEDREALELGKKIKKKRKRKWKQLAAVAAAVAVVFSVGMSGEASRRWILEVWDRIVNAVGTSIRTDYVEDGKNSISMPNMSLEEQSVWKEIKEELGAPMIWFTYLPDGMKFTDYSISKDTNQAFIFYSYKEKIFSVKILVGNAGATSYLQSDVDLLLQDSIINDQEIVIRIWNMTTKGIESYMSDLETQDCTFVFSAALSFEEYEEIMRNIYII